MDLVVVEGVVDAEDLVDPVCVEGVVDLGEMGVGDILNTWWWSA